jgi:hypothetical protein
METFKWNYGRMMASFRYSTKPNKTPLIHMTEQIQVMIYQCLGTSPTAPIRRRHFYKKIGMAKVTGALFLLNTNSVVKRSGFDTTNRIETLEDQMTVLHRKLSAGAVQGGDDESSDPPSDRGNDPDRDNDNDDDDDDDPPPQQQKKPFKTDPNERPDPDPIPEKPERNQGQRENFL